jgi:hypothetical protein
MAPVPPAPPCPHPPPCRFLREGYDLEQLLSIPEDDRGYPSGFEYKTQGKGVPPVNSTKRVRRGTNHRSGVWEGGGADAGSGGEEGLVCWYGVGFMLSRQGEHQGLWSA